MPTDSDFARLVAATTDKVASYQSTRDRYWLTRHYVAASTFFTLAANGIFTALKITAAEWIISGTGLT